MSFNKTAIVLGANGFLGQNLCYWLVQHQYKVLAVGRSETFAAQTYFTEGSIQYLQSDLSDLHQMKQLPIATADVIYMMAGQTGTKAGFAAYNDYVNANELALLHLLNVYVQQNAKGRIVFPSSRLVYKGKEGIFLEESSEKEAKTVYAANKIACELYLSCWANAFQVPYTIFRICVPYGQLLPGNYSYGTLGFMLNQAKSQGSISLFGAGEPKRTFTHVEDICEIMGLVPFQEASNTKIFNIGSDDNFELSKLAQLIANKFQANIEYKDWPDMDLLIESGDTMFSDAHLQQYFPYSYKNKIENFIDQLN